MRAAAARPTSWSGGTDLDSRVVVGGGGGGGGGFGGSGRAGVGGGEDGGSALVESGATGEAGGSQSAGGTGGSTNGIGKTGVDGAFGTGGTGGGGDAVNGGGGGGGGGWYGGGGGGGVVPVGAAAAGGGGSGFGDTLVSGVDVENGGNGTGHVTYTAGDTSCLQAPLTIKKVANGPTTPGQTFTVHVSCPNGTIAEGDTDLSDVDLAFTVDGSGTVQPAAGQTIGFLEETECTITETGTGGATSVSYACHRERCQAVEARRSALGGVEATTDREPRRSVPDLGSAIDTDRVDIVASGQAATVTVTNTMPAAAPAPVVVTPRFTGYVPSLACGRSGTPLLTWPSGPTACPEGSSSICRAPVSKTGGWGFESLLPCSERRSPRSHSDTKAMNRQSKRLMEKQGSDRPRTPDRKAPASVRSPPERGLGPASTSPRSRASCEGGMAHRREVVNSTIIVLIAVVVMTSLIFGFDYASSKFVLFLFG